MENQFNSDSEHLNPEKPSISLVGLLASAEIPNLKEIYREDDLGVVAVHIVDDKFVLHSQFFGRPDRSKLERAREVSIAIDEEFRKRGVKTLYTWAETDEQYRYNMFLGFRPNGNEMVFANPYPNPVYEFEKELAV